MDTLSNYRKRALASLEHGWGTFVCATLVYLVISSICQSFTRIDEESASLAGLSLVMTILLLPLIWGFYTMYLDHIRGEKVGLGNLFQREFDISSMQLFCFYQLFLCSFLASLATDCMQ